MANQYPTSSNPLAADSGVGEDTCASVQFILKFMRDAFWQSAATGDAFSESAMMGAGYVLDMCHDALHWKNDAAEGDPAEDALKQV